MFAYCENNPSNKVDPTGHFWEELWGFIETVGEYIGEAITSLSPAYAGCAAAVVADGPLPFGDIAAAVVAGACTIGAVGYGIYNAVTSPPSVKLDAKEITEALARTRYPEGTLIYRYGGTNPSNLTPKEKDRYSGLSFSTIPQPGAAFTTIEAINATGVLFAVKDSETHVSVRPTTASVSTWINTGPSSVWTKALQAVVFKLK